VVLNTRSQTNTRVDTLSKDPGGSMIHTSLSPIQLELAPALLITKKGALDSQPQVIKLTSCLTMVDDSLRVLRLLPLLKLIAMISSSCIGDRLVWIIEPPGSLDNVSTRVMVWLIVFNTTFNNISVLLWWSVVLVEENRRKPPTCRKSLTNFTT
jgi:hypothetical protein